MKQKQIVFLALPLGMLATTANTLAAPHDSLEEVIITASPHGKSSGDVAGSLNVLSGDILRREAAATLGETLKGQVGINASSFGPGVGLPVIRGLSGSRVEVLQNSSPVADASSTSPDHAIALEPLLADRIEILRGPATLRYGPGAIGGVVNVIDSRIHTQPHEGVNGAVEARYDTNTAGTAYVGRLDGGAGPLAIHAGGLLRDSDNIEIPDLAAQSVDDPDETTDGFVANTDAEANAWNLGISRVTDPLVAGLAISRVDSNYGIPPGGHGHDEEVHGHEGEDDHEEEGDFFTRIDMEQTEYSGKLLFRDLPGTLDRLDIDLTHSDYRHREVEVEEGVVEIGTRYAVRENHLRAELTHDTAGWLGALGIQASLSEFSASGAEAFVQPNEVRTGGFFTTGETDLGPGTLSLGLRYDRQTAEPDAGAGDISHNLVNASASYLLPLGDNRQLSLIYAHSQRAPTAEELFADGEHAATNSYQVGDASLDREAANSLELTWSLEGPIAVNASIYHREFSDFIYEGNDASRFSHHLEEEGFAGPAACTTDPGEFDDSEEEFEEAMPCYFYRQENARFTGAELELITLINDNTSMRLWGDTVRAKLDDGGDVPRIPPARLGANLDFSNARWVAGIGVTHGFEQDRPGAGETVTGSYTRLDAHLSFGRENWTLFLKGSNLTDDEIRNATSFLRELAPEPGRSVELGVRLTY